jgi:hypothetical protein
LSAHTVDLLAYRALKSQRIDRQIQRGEDSSATLSGKAEAALNRHLQSPHFALQPLSAGRGPIVSGVIGGQPQRAGAVKGQLKKHSRYTDSVIKF